jgi:hypothetical protein
VPDQQAASGIESPTRVDELDEYFDRLSAAFASRMNAAVEGPPEPASPAESPFAVNPHRDIVDVSQAGRDPVEWPSAGIASGNVLDRPAAPASEHAGDVPATAPREKPAALPALADAFAALLAAEEEKSAHSRAPAAPAVVNDDIVEQVTRRVLAQFSDGVVRETVANLVAEIAERLIREEIERIKALIK